MEDRRRVVLVTGASSGIGRAAAQGFAAAGCIVFGTGRAPAATEDGAVRMLPLDVRDEPQVRACVETVVAEAGPIDVLVSNAGEMLFGPVEEVPLDRAHAMFETNFWGAARMVSAVLPGMRVRRRGCVVLVGSIAGDVAIPLNGYYAASKAALARYAEALRHETVSLGVRVVLVEPGDVKTRLWEGSRVAMPSIPDYAGARAAVLSALRSMIEHAPEPAAVGAAIVHAASDEGTAPVVRVGAMARRLRWMRALMPAAVFERGVRRRFGLEGA